MAVKKSFFEDPPNHTDNEATDFEEFLHLLARYRQIKTTTRNMSCLVSVLV